MLTGGDDGTVGRGLCERVLIGGALAAVLLVPAFSASARAVETKAPMPIVNTGYGESPTPTVATIKGSISPQGSALSYYFEYGSTAAYGARTTLTPLQATSSTVHVSAQISGLTPYTTYHFRLVTEGPAGTVGGEDHTFTTARIPLAITMTVSPNPVIYGQPVQINGSLTGTESAGHPVVLQASPASAAATFKYLTPTILTSPLGSFFFLVTSLTETSRLRIEAPGPTATYGTTITEFVAVEVTLHVHKTRRRGWIRLYGTVTPSVVGAQVVLQYTRTSGSSLGVADARTKAAKNNTAQFSHVIHLRRRGLYRALVVVPTGRLASGQSHVVMVR